MTDDAKIVFAAFCNLSPGEREELLDEFNKYQSQPYEKKREIREIMEKSASIILGPTSAKCPCCGR